jgi:general L-amino acid transport system substrate-binding protein
MMSFESAGYSKRRTAITIFRNLKSVFRFVVCASMLLAAPASRAGTLDSVKDTGAVSCGVIENGRGLTEQDASGHWHGLFIDYCRALAAATLGDAQRIIVKPLSTHLRFEALKLRDIDVLMANTTITLSRNVSMAVDFPAVYYYDGQGFMAHKNVGGLRFDEVDNRKVCVLGETTTASRLDEYIKEHHKSLSPIWFKDNEESFNAFFARSCDIVTTDRLILTAQRALHAPDPSTYTIYPDVISKEPLAPAVRSDDHQWSLIVKWAVLVPIAAEEMGITSSNVSSYVGSQNPEIRRLLGLDPAINQDLGLTSGWGARIIESVGNYGEIFDRNLGLSTELRLERGLNALWNHGGLIYAPPFL